MAPPTTTGWKHSVWPETPRARTSLGTPLVRVLAGSALMHHGRAMLHDPLHWMGNRPGTPPGALHACAAMSEFFGGLGLIAGLFTPLAAFWIACTVASAVCEHASHGDPFVASGRSYESAPGYLATAFLLILAGPGRFSLETVILGREPRGR